MKNEESKIDEKNKGERKRRPYVRPLVESEDLMVFGAVCNGTTKGGRKASVAAPNFCNSARLNS